VVARLDFTLKRRGRVVRPEDLFKGLDQSFGKFLFRNMRESFIRDGDEFVGEMVATVPVRTGQLRRSVTRKVSGSRIDDLKLSAASRGHPGALVQEHGAVIRARRAKYLTIPGPAVKTSAGVARTSFKSWISQQRRGGYVMLPTKKPGGWVVIGKTPTGKLKKLHAWVLKKEVTIPGPDTTGTKSNFGFMDTWDRYEDARLQRGLKAIVKSIRDTMVEGKR